MTNDLFVGGSYGKYFEITGRNWQFWKIRRNGFADAKRMLGTILANEMDRHYYLKQVMHLRTRIRHVSRRIAGLWLLVSRKETNMAKVIMVQGTMSNAGKAWSLQDFAVFLRRMAIAWYRLNHRIWHSTPTSPKTVWRWGARRSCRRKRRVWSLPCLWIPSCWNRPMMSDHRWS